MPPPPDMELLSREDRVVLAVDLLKFDVSLRVRSVAAVSVSLKALFSLDAPEQLHVAIPTPTY
jgi:hypothetical protein